MQVTLTWQTLITAAAVLAAATALIVAFAKLVRWVDAQKKQSADIAKLEATHNADMEIVKQELALLVEGVLACLQGHKEQGCNGPVTKGIEKLETYLNQKAHE